MLGGAIKVPVLTDHTYKIQFYNATKMINT